jgi:hypothetical protein
LDDALNRVLEVLQRAAARKAAAAALAARLQHTSGPAAAAAAAAGSLAQLNVADVAALVSQLAPEVQRAVEDDLGAYTSMCMKLR